ncbi:pectate lyase [Phlyctema vagabunda]|uniref:Pectate lyase n=1 Tax=Phlyctema vagabunda TaxID=108571 RepID=A0ABR4PCQ6_9HELO
MVFIDCARPYLVLSENIDGTPDYATLSHCWGQTTFETLTLANLTQFQREIPIDAFSKTFTDAIHTAQKLDIQYMWIDSLCIIQDDTEDWRSEASVMSSIYTNSKINICATGAKDGNVGLFQEREWVSSCRVSFYSPEIGSNVTCTATPHRLYAKILDQMPLLRRGWAVQERILPCRNIHFTVNEVLWECHQSVASEILPNGFAHMQDLSTHSEYFRKRPLQRHMWRWIMELYTSASLTYKKDRLVALSGIAKMIHDQTKIEYLAGLWRDTLETDLLWRRFPGRDSRRPRPYLAPSWSWGSYEDRIVPSEVGVWGRSRMRSCIKILDAEVTPRNTFGEVFGGIIRLSCDRLIQGTFDASYKLLLKRPWSRGNVWLDSKADTMVSKVYLLPIFMPENDLHGLPTVGLLLQPSGKISGQFIRVEYEYDGYFPAIPNAITAMLFFYLFLFALLPASLAQQLAFPGAEGFGRYAKGGRGGSVYVVTNLNDSGTGSLRNAVSATDRIVVFAVGGLITIDSRIVVSKRVTILGQTAPGDGITVYGNGWSFSNADDAIVRYIRIRMGKGGDSGKDGVTIAEGKNMIFDHVSVSWGRDETFSISGEVYNITIQNSIVAQGLETHSCGGLIQTDGGVSLFRNLYIDNKTRNPKVKGINDFTNNVVYNWGGGGGYIAGDSDGTSFANIMGNYFISGPSTSVTAFTRGNANFNGYVLNNYYDPGRDGTLDGTILGASSSNYGGMVLVATRYNYPPVARLLTAPDAVTYVTTYAGASKVRDSIDTRLVAEVRSWGKTGELISDETASPMNGPGTIAGGTVATDTDGDGIPDSAEAVLGTNPNVVDSIGDANGNGYANVEDWANSLVPSSY